MKLHLWRFTSYSNLEGRLNKIILFLWSQLKHTTALTLKKFRAGEATRKYIGRGLFGPKSRISWSLYRTVFVPNRKFLLSNIFQLRGVEQDARCFVTTQKQQTDSRCWGVPPRQTWCHGLGIKEADRQHYNLACSNERYFLQVHWEFSLKSLPLNFVTKYMCFLVLSYWKYENLRISEQKAKEGKDECTSLFAARTYNLTLKYQITFSNLLPLKS